MARRAVDEHAQYARPSKRGSRPRTKQRPEHADAEVGMVTGVDRGRYTLVVDDGTASWSGTVSVHNPSSDTALTVDVTDLPAVQGWTCSFDDDSTAVVLAAGKSATLGYTCEGSGHAGGTNTAKVSFGELRTTFTSAELRRELGLSEVL